MTTLKLDFHSNFQVHNRVSLPIATMLYFRSPKLIHLTNKSLCLLTSISPLPLTFNPWQPSVYFLFLGFLMFSDSPYTWDHAVFVFLHISIPFPLFINQWSVALLPCLCNCEQCCSEHEIADISLREWFHFLQKDNQEWDWWMILALGLSCVALHSFFI